MKNVVRKIKKFIKKTWKRGKPSELEQENAKELSDYVGVEEVDSVSRDTISLYQCEMPEQTLAKIKAQEDSLLRLKDLPLGLRSLSRPPVSCGMRLSEPCFLVAARLVSKETHKRGLNEDYMMMDEVETQNYDDYMYYSSQDDSQDDSPPPYSEVDPYSK